MFKVKCLKYFCCRGMKRRYRSKSLDASQARFMGIHRPKDPSPLHAKRMISERRSDRRTRVRISGADMCDIYRAYVGRLNMSYWSAQDNEQGFFLFFFFSLRQKTKALCRSYKNKGWFIIQS